MVSSDHQREPTRTYELSTRVTLGNMECNLRDHDQYLWISASQECVLTISERSRYSPAGREAGITTLCFPVSCTYQPSKRTVRKPKYTPLSALTMSVAHCWDCALRRPEE